MSDNCAGQNAPRRVSNQHNDCQEILQKFYQQQKQQQERLQGEQSRLKTLMSLNVPELFSAACNLKIRNTTTPGQMNQTLTNSRNDRRSCSQTGTVGSSWNSDAEHKLNEMINTELEAFYNYLVMFAYYDKNEVALKGFAKYFLRQAFGELQHALKLIRYVNKRGGDVKLCEINAPQVQCWSCPKDAIQCALEVEKRESNSMMEVHNCATSRCDHHLTNFLVTDFMEAQLQAMKDLSQRLTHCCMVGNGAGLYIYDRDLYTEECQREEEKNPPCNFYN